MPIVTIDLDQLSPYAQPAELSVLYLHGRYDRTRGVLPPEWTSRLAVPLEARGFRINRWDAPIHFWRNQERTGFVFAQ